MAVCNDDRLPDIECTRHVEIVHAEIYIGAIGRARLHAAHHAFGRKDFRRHFMRAAHEEAFILEQSRHAGQQMIVAAAKGFQHPRYEQQITQARPRVPYRRPHKSADEDDLAAPGGLRQADKLIDLADIQPVMRVAFDRCTFSGADQRKQHDLATTRRDIIGDRQRQGAAAANHGQRSFRRRGRIAAHCRSSGSLRIEAMVSGRLPARMNSTMRITSPSPA